jgi:3-hydroxyisobutyrate dehydrogenase-like beta-hydroxyacid dehydrogenase
MKNNQDLKQNELPGAANIEKVTVIGLGSMGSTIARLFLKSGYQVTVWNRTPGRAASLAAEGAELATDIDAAIKASAFIVVCVLDYKASNEIFRQVNPIAFEGGKTVIQFTTGSPKEARESESWFRQRNTAYLDGAIQVAPDQMARPDTTILLSGEKQAYENSRKLLEVLGGNFVYLGDKISAAATMDLATLSYVYGSAMGFFQGILFAETEGFDLNTYGSLIRDIAPNMGEFLKHEASVIQSNDFTISQSPLSISIEATKRIHQSLVEAGLYTDLSEVTVKLHERAESMGLADKEAAVLIRLLRSKQAVDVSVA